MQTLNSVLAALATILAFMRAHWVAIIVVVAVWMVSNIISGMPAPNGGPPTGTWWYKWLFATLHIATGSVGRVLAVVPMPDWLRSLLKALLLGADPKPAPNAGAIGASSPVNPPAGDGK